MRKRQRRGREGGMERWSQLRQLVQNRGRMEGGSNRVREEEGRLSFCLLLQTLNRLEGVQC